MEVQRTHSREDKANNEPLLHISYRLQFGPNRKPELRFYKGVKVPAALKLGALWKPSVFYLF